LNRSKHLLLLAFTISTISTSISLPLPSSASTLPLFPLPLQTFYLLTVLLAEPMSPSMHMFLSLHPPLCATFPACLHLDLPVLLFGPLGGLSSALLPLMPCPSLALIGIFTIAATTHMFTIAATTHIFTIAATTHTAAHTRYTAAAGSCSHRCGRARDCRLMILVTTRRCILLHYCCIVLQPALEQFVRSATTSPFPRRCFSLHLV
jgi:hypothetical protein